MKLGVITDGISRSLERGLLVLNECDIRYAELQYIGDQEVGDLDDSDVFQIKELTETHQVKVSCISRHIFGGLSVIETERNDSNYLSHIKYLKRCIQMAKVLDCSLVRIMSFRKEMILFGSRGAEIWNVSKGAWKKLISLMELPVQIAEEEGITLVVETGNNAMITSAVLARKLVDELGTNNLKVLWDPCNSLYCNEVPYPDGYTQLKDGYIGHIHMKDAFVNIPGATIECTALGKGHMNPYLKDLSLALKQEAYDGVISLESVYRPDNKTFEDGFIESLRTFKQIFET